MIGLGLDLADHEQNARASFKLQVSSASFEDCMAARGASGHFVSEVQG